MPAWIRDTKSLASVVHRVPMARAAPARMRFDMSTTVVAVERSARNACPPFALTCSTARSNVELFPMRRCPYTSNLAAGSRSTLVNFATSVSRSVKNAPLTVP